MTEETDLFLTLKEDYQEALELFNDAVLRLENAPRDRDSLETASRQLHNIKGFANRLRAPKLGQLAHLLEDVLMAVRDGRAAFDEDLAEFLFQGVDLFVHYLRAREIPANKMASLVGEVEFKLFTEPDEETIRTEVEDLLPDFIAAARDNVEAINQGLFNLEKDPADSETLQEVYRNAHSLKGSAMTMGFARMGKLAHRMEDVLRAFQEKHLSISPEHCDALFEANDAISVMLDTRAGSTRTKVNVETSMSRLAGFLSRGGGKAEVVRAEPAVADQGPEPVAPAPVAAIDTVRVPTAKLDEMVNLAGEAVIAQIRLANELDGLMRIRDRWQRLRFWESGFYPSAGGELEDDAGFFDEMVSLGDSLEETSRFLLEAAESSGRHIEALQHHTMEIRMLPLSLVFNTLPRVVRDLSRQFEKKVNFEIQGQQTTIDKRILEQIGDPLVHLLRNALDHGIESPEVRGQKGKPETATIRLRANQEGSKVSIILEDDGQGIDVGRIKKVAINKGFLQEDELRDMAEDQLLSLIFLPGFSTSALVTDISGRGVGMDVVRANVERLKGQVEVTSEPGEMTRFTISLPLSLATVHTLMLQCGGEILAVPTFSVLRTLQFPVEEIKAIQGRQAVVYQGEILPVRSMAAALGWEETDADLLIRERALLVVIRAGERKVGFLVDEILGEREVISKNLGSHLRKVRYVAGATILGSGEVALILDVPQLLWQEEAKTRQRLQEQPEETQQPSRRQVILVVEDQVVTRQMEQSILEAAGYQVVTAENGLDAIKKLGEQNFDLVVTDIQMPKMDGFTLTRKIRGNEATQDLPVVIVTSMEREEDKRCGLEVGADAYLIKSSFDQRNLIDTIEALLGERTP